MLRLCTKCDSFKNNITKQISVLTYSLIYVRKKSYYDVLGLNSTASAKDIKSAYYKLSFQFHPDKNDGNPESIAKFREVTEAYEVLSSPEKKKLYDNRNHFQYQYSGNQSYTGNNYGTKYYRGPYTGKTSDFNYDEHFRQHYQAYEKHRQAEHEYFKMRWEAEFKRRYPDSRDYYRAKYAENKEDVSKEFARKRHSLMILFSLWGFLAIVQILHEVFNPNIPNVRGPIYYGVQSENNEVQNDSSK